MIPLTAPALPWDTTLSMATSVAGPDSRMAESMASWPSTGSTFPSIATGVYAYPKEEAVKIAYEVIKECIYIKDIVFVFYTKENSMYLEKQYS